MVQQTKKSFFPRNSNVFTLYFIIIVLALRHEDLFNTCGATIVFYKLYHCHLVGIFDEPSTIKTKIGQK